MIGLNQKNKHINTKELTSDQKKNLLLNIISNIIYFSVGYLNKMYYINNSCKKQIFHIAEENDYVNIENICNTVKIDNDYSFNFYLKEFEVTNNFIQLDIYLESYNLDNRNNTYVLFSNMSLATFEQNIYGSNLIHYNYYRNDFKFSLIDLLFKINLLLNKKHIEELIKNDNKCIYDEDPHNFIIKNYQEFKKSKLSNLQKYIDIKEAEKLINYLLNLK